MLTLVAGSFFFGQFKEHLCVVKCLLILLHLLSDKSVLRIQGLFLRQGRSVFFGKCFDLWKLGDVHFFKSVLCCLVKCDFFTVGLKECFAIPGFPIGNIRISRFCVVYNMLFQGSNFYQPLFGGFQILGNAVKLRCGGICFFPKLLHGTNPLFFEENSGFGHLL